MSVNNISDDEVDGEVTPDDECPDCGGKLIRTQACKQCRECGLRLC